MTFSYKVELLPDENGGYRHGGGDKDVLRTNFSITWQVLVTTDDPDNENPATDIGLFDVLALSELPVVNQSIYYTNQFVFPRLVCRSKTGQRDAVNRGRWTVKTDYDTGDDKQDETKGQPFPGDVSGYGPTSEYSLGEEERVLYNDKDNTRILLPTGNYYSEPVIERLATLVKQVRQYETGTTWDTLRARKFATNSSSYDGKGANSWIITDAQKTTVQLPIGVPPAISFVQREYCTYVMAYTTKPNGWLAERALIDTHFLTAANDLTTKRPFIDEEFGTYTSGMLNANGTKKANQATDEIEYVPYKAQPPISYSFLQT